MKRLKQSLLASTVMLLVAAVMLTSASFAWFTISTNPEIRGMDMQVVVNENLEIALDNGYNAEDAVDTASGTGDGNIGNAYTWGNLIALGAEPANTATTNYGTLDKTLRPATYTESNVFKTASYGPDGRVEGIDITLGKVDNNDGFGNLQDPDDPDNLNYGYYVDFWVRTNMEGPSKLTLIGVDGEDRSSEGETGDGSTFTTDNEDLANNIRFSFVDITNEAAQLATMAPVVPATFVADVALPLGYVDDFAGTGGAASEVAELTRNTAKKIRMYVYLEGANVTSSSASIEDALVSGDLNLQFTIGGLQSMDMD